MWATIKKEGKKKPTNAKEEEKKVERNRFDLWHKSCPMVRCFICTVLFTHFLIKQNKKRQQQQQKNECYK